MHVTTPKNAILTQLRALATLTNTEIMIAETRTAQARTDAIRTELSENAAQGRERVAAIEDAIREFGAVPAVVGPTVGRIGAMVKSMFEQAQPFDEAVLGDLALEYQLLARATYLKALSSQVDDDKTTELADRLITAHNATIEWLTTVLAEEAIGGPVALRRTPLQSVAALGSTVLNLPGNWIVRVGDNLADAAKQVPAQVGELVRWGGSTEEPTVADLAIAGYDDLNASDVVAELRALDDPAAIRTVVSYEEAHKNRSTVLSAAEAQLASIANGVVGVS